MYISCQQHHHRFQSFQPSSTLLIFIFLFSAYLLTEFDKFWFDEEPRDIREFNRVRNKFKKSLLHRLKCKTTMLGIRRHLRMRHRRHLCLCDMSTEHCTIMYCTIMYCTIMYCTIMYCTIMYCTIMYCSIMYCTIMYCSIM